MEFKASARHQHMAPRKVRRVVDLVRGLPVDEALNVLRLCPQRPGRALAKLIRSALAAAAEAHDADAEDLVIRRAWVDGGPLRYWRLPRPRGMWSRIRRRTSHIHVVLADRADEAPDGEQTP